MRSVPVIVGALALAVGATQSHAQQARVRATSRPALVRVLTDGDSARAALGLATASGSKRDTLGVLVTSIVSGSPAEKAGLQEGDRLAAINGVSLQLSPEDAGDPEMDGLMGRRLQRAMRKVKPGDTVHLRVYANGQFKTVDVRAASESDVFARAGWHMRLGDGEELGALPPVPPMAPMPPMAPGCCGERVILERSRAAERARRGAERSMRDAERRLRRMRFDFDGGARAFGSASRGRISVDERGDSITATASGDSYVLRVAGLQLAPVSADLASYFGAGSEKGLLVLNAESRTGLHAGDVILGINGQNVRRDDTARLSISTREDNAVELLRRGKRVTVTMKGEG